MLNIGDPAPQFSGIDAITGQTHNLSDFAGKVVMLIFSGPSWCDPCKYEAPVLEELWQTFKSSWTQPQVQLLMKSVLDPEELFKQAVQQFGLTFPALGYNANVDVAALYGVEGVPTIFVLDTEQKVCAIHVGASGTVEELYEELYGLLMGCGAAEPATLGQLSRRWRAIANILFGVIQDGGGLAVTPGGKPIPIDPWGPLLRMSTAQQDLYANLAIAQLANSLHDGAAANEIRTASLRAAEAAIRAIAASAVAAPEPGRARAPMQYRDERL
jgi:thiol-disulfide isomerase/thioredoxin